MSETDKQKFQRLNHIINHAQHLDVEELRWLVRRLQEKEIPLAEASRQKVRMG